MYHPKEIALRAIGTLLVVAFIGLLAWGIISSIGWHFNYQDIEALLIVGLACGWAFTWQAYKTSETERKKYFNELFKLGKIKIN